MRQALQGQETTLDGQLDMIIEKYGNNLKKNQKQKAKIEAENAAKKAKPTAVKEIPAKKKPGVKEQI
jgi:hypothetical protein